MAGLISTTVMATEFSYEGIEGRFDSTVSMGASFRVEDQDEDLIGVANGGRANSINYDNGNLNYEPGDLVSLNARAVHELEANYLNFGFFGRFYYYYDLAVRDIPTNRTPINHAAREEAGGKLKLLDAYLTSDFYIADRAITVRAGNQLLSWGESTFIQNGINIINPVDVSQLRVAGASALKEAFLPVPMISLNAEITSNISIEAFYQLMWEKTEVDAEGTFFATADHTGPGAERVFLGFGRAPDDPVRPGPTDWPVTPTGALPPIGGSVPRGKDRDADHMGQGGIALRYFAPRLNDTEFGLYYVRYHSRKPLISGQTGPPPFIVHDDGTVTPVGPPPGPVPTGTDFWADLARLAWAADVALNYEPMIEYGTEYGDAGSTSLYFREYPEDIDAMAVSFNTDIPAIGLALQGEFTYRLNQPLQVDDVELLFSALSPMDPYLVPLSVLSGFLATGTVAVPSSYTVFGNSQLGTVGFNEYVRGYRRKDVLQGQMTFTKMFGPMLGMDQFVVLGEIGATYIMDMEDKDELRYEGPGTFTSANPYFTDRTLQPATQEGGFADEFSMGYRAAMRADFNNAIGAINIQPAVAFYHDVQGTTPLPIANFVEDRMTLSASLTFTYLNKIRYNLSYTSYFGGGKFNLINDRDFASVTASYSF